MNGYEWQDMICNYLPKLKVFHLQMSVRFYGGDDIEKQVDEFLDSFRTPFWIDEHHLWIR
jgi:hypothetical protein